MVACPLGSCGLCWRCRELASRPRRAYSLCVRVMCCSLRLSAVLAMEKALAAALGALGLVLCASQRRGMGRFLAAYSFGGVIVLSAYDVWTIRVRLISGSLCSCPVHAPQSALAAAVWESSLFGVSEREIDAGAWRIIYV